MTALLGVPLESGTDRNAGRSLSPAIANGMREYESRSALNNARALTIPAAATQTARSGPSIPVDIFAMSGHPPSCHLVQSLAPSVADKGMRYPSVTRGSVHAS